jgi:hypothetical protein
MTTEEKAKTWQKIADQRAIEVADLRLAAKPFLDAFKYDPGHSDLGSEQPITITVTLGDWRRLNKALR